MQNRIPNSGEGMDAIDALLCLGFRIRKTECGKYVLLYPTFKILVHAINMAVISITKEIQDRVEHHDMLIQQKGLAHGV